MPAVLWPLYQDRPCIEIVLPRAKGSKSRLLIADTGAGNHQSAFQLLLEEADCLTAAGKLMGLAQLGGAYSGQFRVYSIKVQVPALQFVDSVPVVGVTQVPANFAGIACFKFLNRFQYGNFGDRGAFGLEI